MWKLSKEYFILFDILKKMYNFFENSDDNNIKNNISNKINNNISRFCLFHKLWLKAFNEYVDSLDNDIEKLKKVNKQLDNLSKNVNTLPRLFKSFTDLKKKQKD